MYLHERYGLVSDTGATMHIYTIGHSNRSLKDFIDILTSAKIQFLIDVRTHPNSRRYPQFESIRLQQALARISIDYNWQGRQLGGLRRGNPESPHRAITSTSLRAYADHMLTREFRIAAAEIMASANGQCAGLMCAEKYPMRCHRSLIADYLSVRGVCVIHLVDADQRLMHRLRPSAREEGDKLIYDSEAVQLDLRI